MARADKRALGDIRPTKIRTGFMPNADGSCLIETGRTRVLCTACVQKSLPPFLMEVVVGIVLLALVFAVHGDVPLHYHSVCDGE